MSSHKISLIKLRTQMARTQNIKKQRRIETPLFCKGEKKMRLETKNKKIILVFTTRKIVSLANLLKGKNFEDLYFKAMNEKDLDALSKIIFAFAEEEESGAKAFKSSDDVYDFIDDYKQENQKTYEELFEELASAINDEGFFSKKMTKKELATQMSNPLSGTNMNKLIQESAEKAISKIAEQEFQNTKV